MAKMTNAGLALIAQLQADQDILIIDKMIYANIDGLDPETEPPATEVKPDAGEIVRESLIANAGYVDPNTVTYSDLLDATIGDFNFNWIGLYCSEFNTLIAVTYVPLQSKRATAGQEIGNTLCKNFAINYTDIKDLTGIVIQVATWQQDITQAVEAIIAANTPSVAGSTGISFTDAKPANTLWIDGSELPVDAAYNDLNTYLNGIYGTGPGGRSYLPPAKGYFLRVTDGGAGIDPDAASRADRGDGTTGDNVGTLENDEFKSHTHDVPLYEYTTGETDTFANGVAPSNGTGIVNAAGGSETRPKNINIRMYIYY